MATFNLPAGGFSLLSPQSIREIFDGYDFKDSVKSKDIGEYVDALFKPQTQAKSTKRFPTHLIESDKETGMQVFDIVVAGYAKDSLVVELDESGNSIIIKTTDEYEEIVYAPKFKVTYDIELTKEFVSITYLDGGVLRVKVQDKVPPKATPKRLVL